MSSPVSGDAECGTRAAYLRHLKRGEPADEACLMANRDYRRRARALSPATRENDRWWTRTHNRALLRLAAEHPGRFAELLAEVRDRDPDPRLAQERPAATGAMATGGAEI
jgi:hypothetical protein